MTTPSSFSLWVEGARPRTLPAAVAPVLVGTAAAAGLDGFVAWKALTALGVALALQIGVNFANDYSDGIRGTDENRVGPLRLVGSGLVPARLVKYAALGCFGIAALLGVLLAASSGWWLIGVGAVAIVAAWRYTGGPKPYGYAGLGEVSVFVFFGLVATLGTTYVQAGAISFASVAGAIGVGAFASAILVANNLRDIPSDADSGKLTLAVRLGDAKTRTLYIGLVATAGVAAIVAMIAAPWTVLALGAFPVAGAAVTTVHQGAKGPDLIMALRDTGIAELVWALGFAAGLLISIG